MCNRGELETCCCIIVRNITDVSETGWLNGVLWKNARVVKCDVQIFGFLRITI